MQGHIKQVGDHRFRIWLHVGKHQYKSFLVKGTRKFADQERARLIHEFARGEFIEPAKLTVGEYLEKWIAHIQLNVAPKTAERYAEIVRLHLIPAFGETPLHKLHPLQLDAYYAEALAAGSRRGMALSAQTVTHHHRVLRQALEQAVRWRMLKRNPATDTKPPRPVRREMKALDEPQMLALFKRFEGTRLHPVVIVAATTGLRRGELLGLKWSDVDLEGATLTVARSLEETKAGLAFKPPKTAKARRTIDLLPRTVATLRRHATEQKKERLAAGPLWHDEGLVFAAPDGTACKPSALTIAFIARRPGVRFHDLRHSCATMMLRAGVHPKIVSERLGHAGIGITLDTYSHVLPGMGKQAAAQLEAALNAAEGE